MKPVVAKRTPQSGDGQRPMTDPGDTARHTRGTSSDIPDVLTVPQAAELLQLSTKTLKRPAQAQDVPSRRVRNQWRFNRHALMNWLAGKDGRQ